MSINYSEMLHSTSTNPFEETGHRSECETYSDNNPKYKIHTEMGSNISDKENITISTTSNVDEPMTPKSQKPTDVKRWASVVKAKKKIQNSPKSAPRSKQKDVEQESLDVLSSLFKTVPKNFENHLSFISSKDNLVSCNLCQAEFQCVSDLSNHIKTRKHEDSMITFLKEKLPVHLQHAMEFVSFYDSTLCCNLCRCKINMSYDVPHETLLNIIAHNSDKSHTSHKANQDKNNLANELFNSLAGANPEIMENKHIIDKKMNPQYRCKLCNINILYNENKEMLENNFISHFKTTAHIKNKKAVEVLKLFRETSSEGFDNFVITNGCIACTFCNQHVEPDLQQLVSHENGVEHAENVLAMVNSSYNELSETNSHCVENKTNEAKALVFSTQRKDAENNGFMKKPSVFSESKLSDKAYPDNLKNIDFQIENKKSIVTCLICNCMLPSDSHNLKIHLAGAKHKKNEVLKKNSQTKNELSLKNVLNEVTTANNCALDKKEKSLVNTKNAGYLFKNNDKLVCSESQYPANGKQDLLAKARNCQREKLGPKKCTNCLGQTNQSFNNIPESMRTKKCNEQGAVPKSIINHFYCLLVKKNSLILENEDVIVRNVDGRHSYCKLCKYLIPLSLDINALEMNILTHLAKKTHTQKFLEIKGTDKLSNIDLMSDLSGSGGAIRSLFVCSKKRQHPEKIEEMNYPDFPVFSHTLKVSENKEIIDDEENVKPPKKASSQTLNTVGHSTQASVSESCPAPSKKLLHNFLLPQVQKMYPDLADKVISVLLNREEKDIFHMMEQEQSFKIKVEDAVNSIQAEAAKRKSLSPQAFKPVADGLGKHGSTNTTINPKRRITRSISKDVHTSLPVSKISRTVKYDIETDEEVLSRRQKQIDYGKNTEGYTRYCNMIPKRKREPFHPGTPPRNLKCSRRTWDGMIRIWRRQLHNFDPPHLTDQDIQPLPL